MPREPEASGPGVISERWLGRRELQTLLAEDGRAAGLRRLTLERLLAELAREAQAPPRDVARRALIAEIHAALADPAGARRAPARPDDRP